MMRTYSLAEIAESLGVHARTVEAWISAGELRAVNVSRSRDSQKPRLRVTDSELQRFIESRSTEQQKPESRCKRRTDIPRYV